LCQKTRFNIKEVLFLSYSGLIKGAICFGLMAEMEEKGVWCNEEGVSHCNNASVIRNTITYIVIATTILYGGICRLII
jgi:hypothetical protein